MSAARPFRATATGDVFVVGDGTSQPITMLGARLVAGSGASATAQLADANGTVLADFAAPAGGSDSVRVPVIAIGKVSLQTLSGAGAAVDVFIL